MFFWYAPSPLLAPPINVTVQPPPGLPTWEVAMIGGVVGALTAFLMNIMLEFLKPLVARKLTKRRMKEEITKEFMINFQKIVNSWKIVEDATDRGGAYIMKAVHTLPSLHDTIRRTMFDDHFSKNLSTYYEIEPEGSLLQFYDQVKSQVTEPNPEHLGVTRLAYFILNAAGEKYCREQKISFPTFEKYWFAMYEQTEEDGTIPIVISDDNPE